MAKDSGRITGSNKPEKMASSNIERGEIQTASRSTFGPADFSEGYGPNKGQMLANKGVKLGKKS